MYGIFRITKWLCLLSRDKRGGVRNLRQRNQTLRLLLRQPPSIHCLSSNRMDTVIWALLPQEDLGKYHLNTLGVHLKRMACTPVYIIYIHISDYTSCIWRGLIEYERNRETKCWVSIFTTFLGAESIPDRKQERQEQLDRLTV